MGTGHPDVQHFFFFPVHIFIFGCAGSLLLLRLLSSCSRQGRGGGSTLQCQCSSFSLWCLLLSGAQALGTQASGATARGLSSCGLRALEQWVSTSVAQG